MAQMKLLKEHRQHLKSMAHSMKPLLQLGDKGLSESFINEANGALAYHELIKIRIHGSDRAEKDIVTTDLVAALDAVMIQRIGNVVTLFKRNHASPKIFFKSS